MQNQTNNKVVADKTPLPTRNWWQRLLALFIILALLVVGFLIAKHLMETKPTAQKKPPSEMQTLVKTMLARPADINVSVNGFGNIIPAREVNITARVAGEVKYIHPDFVPGGTVKAGELLVRLDDQDYQIALQQKENALTKALADLRIEEGNQAVAKKEWELINEFTDDIDPTSVDLALRKPQLKMANAAIKVAETDIEKARLDLARTEITAPFNAVVRQKNINLGTQVSNSSNIATLVDIDTFWAIISLPVDKVGWLELPSKKSAGSAVTVYSNSANVYKGRIVNLLPDLDEDGMMARLLIEIADPMGLESGNPPLPIGSFVEARIIGKELKQAYKVPRAALQGDDEILTATDQKTLHIKKVTVLWKDADWAYLDKSLPENTKIITSKVAAPLEGMLLELWQSDGGENVEKNNQQGEQRNN